MSIAGNQSKITNRDLFAITLRYAMESDLAVERYAKRYKGELTPSLFAEDDKPAWIVDQKKPKNSEWDESKHPRVEKGSKAAHGGQFTSAKQQSFAGLTLADTVGKVGAKPDYDKRLEALKERRDPDGIESNEKLPLFDQAAKIFEESAKATPKVASRPPVVSNEKTERAIEELRRVEALTKKRPANNRDVDRSFAARSVLFDHGWNSDDVENALKQPAKAQDSKPAKTPETPDGSKPKAPSPGIVMPSNTVANEDAKPGDQLGLFGEATKAKAPSFKPKLLDQPKQANLFDTKGNPDQMDLFGDAAMPDDLVYKPEAKQDADADSMVNRSMGARAEEGARQSATENPSAEHRDSAIKQGLASVKRVPHLTSGSQAEMNALDPWNRLSAEQRAQFSGHKEFASEVGKAFQADRDGAKPESKPAAFKPKLLDKPKDNPEDNPHGLTGQAADDYHFAKDSVAKHVNESSDVESRARAFRGLLKDRHPDAQAALARHIATEYIKSKYSNAFEPVLLEQYAKPSSTYVDDGDLLYDPIREQYASALSCLIERYDWNSSKHPRDALGRFTKTRELAEHPTLQAHHSLNIKNQAPAVGLKLKDYRSGFNNLLSNAARAATFKNADPKFQPTEEDIWANVDKQALQKMLADINAADKQSMAGEGPKLHELFNANQIIPRMIAERLHGGSRFFDPEKLRGRWNEPSPESKPEQSKMDKLLGGNDLPAFKPQLLDKPQEPAQAPTQAEPQQPEQQPEQVDAPMPARSNRPGGKLSPRMLESATMKTVLDPEALNPEPSQASEPTPTKPQPEAPAKPKRAAKPKPDRSETGGLSKAMHNKVTKAIADLIGGDNPEMIEAFRPVLMDAWNRKTQEVVQHNQAVRTATAGKSPGVIMNMVKNARNKTLDPAKKKNFDTMVDGFERGPFGYMLNGRGEDGMIELLAEGIKPLPTVLDPDVASDAVTMAGPDFFGAYDQGEVPSETSNEWDAVPFSWAAAKAIVERYRREAKVERYASKAKKQKSCTMLTLSKSDAKPIVQFGESIPKSDLYESLDKEWCDGPLEKESHVTVLYGLTNHNVEPVLEKISGFGSVTVTLGKIAIFSSEKYDVLKIDVDGKRLRELNEKLRELPHESDFPDYKPHLTIAYLKKGSGAAYVGDDRFDGKEITFDSMTFSPPKEIRESAGKPELSLIGSNEKYSQTTCDGFIRELLAQKEKLVPVIANRAIEMLIERRRYAPTLIS